MHRGSTIWQPICKPCTGSHWPMQITLHCCSTVIPSSRTVPSWKSSLRWLTGEYEHWGVGLLMIQTAISLGLSLKPRLTRVNNGWYIINVLSSHTVLKQSSENEVHFDVEIAIKVLRQAGYHSHAVFLAEKHMHHEWYLKIQLEDLKVQMFKPFFRDGCSSLLWATENCPVLFFLTLKSHPMHY